MVSVSTLNYPERKDSLLLSLGSKRTEFLTGYATLQEYHLSKRREKGYRYVTI